MKCRVEWTKVRSRKLSSCHCPQAAWREMGGRALLWLFGGNFCCKLSLFLHYSVFRISGALTRKFGTFSPGVLYVFHIHWVNVVLYLIQRKKIFGNILFGTFWQIYKPATLLHFYNLSAAFLVSNISPVVFPFWICSFSKCAICCNLFINPCCHYRFS